MPRKLEYKIHDWLPYIVKAALEYETLNTFEIVKSVGGIRRDLGDAQIQFNEIKAVLDDLVQAGYLAELKTEGGHYWGIEFNSITYSQSDKFNEFVANFIFINNKNEPGENFTLIINQKSYSFNLTIAIKELLGKIAEFKLF